MCVRGVGGHGVKAITKMRGAADLCKAAMDGWLNGPLGPVGARPKLPYCNRQQPNEYPTIYLFRWSGYMHQPTKDF